MRYGLNDWQVRQGKTSFPVQSSVLDEEALLSEVLNDYCIPAADSCCFLSRGDADIYRVCTGEGLYYLKVYRPPQSLVRSEAEARFVAALSSKGVPVVNPIPRMDGRYASQVSAPEGTRPMLLFETAPPPLPAQLDEALLTQIGEKVALVHTTADQFDTDFNIPATQSGVFLEEWIYYASRFLSAQDCAIITTVSRSLGDALQELPQEKPDFGLCHADLVLSNLRLTEEGVVTLFDFGNVIKIWRAFELAVVFWSLGNRYRDDRDRLWLAFLQGYSTYRPLPEQFSQRLKLMLVLRQVAFIGGNCASLPLRLGTETFESGFVEQQVVRLRALAVEAGLD